MPRLLLIAVLMVLLCVSLYGQANNSPPCPSITVNGPSGIPNPGEPIIFSAMINNPGGRPLNLEYDWFVSHGRITKGQGTLDIEVTLPNPSGMTATVEIKGLPTGCPNTASENLMFDALPAATKLDEFTGPIGRIVPSRVERIRMAIMENPSAQLYVHIGSGTNGTAEIRRHALLKAISKNSIDASRITFVDNESASELTQIWLVPAGASPPTCEECQENKVKGVPTCLAISVSGPTTVPKPGELTTFTAHVETSDWKPLLKYIWLVSAGQIVSGRNTSEIKVRTPRSGVLTATVTVKGLPEGCDDSASETIPEHDPPFATIVDEYGVLNFENETARINSAVDQLRAHPKGKLLIIKYVPENQTDQINANIRRLKRHLSDEKHIPLENFEIISAVGTGELTKVYIVPEGSSDPTP